MSIYSGVARQMTDLGSQVVGDSSRHRVTGLTGRLVVQSAAGALKKVKKNKGNIKTSFKTVKRPEGKKTKKNERKDAHLSYSQSAAVARCLNFLHLDTESRLNTNRCNDM